MNTLKTSVLALGTVAATLHAQSPDSKPLGYQDTPIIPGTKWHVHDGERPQPRIITPGENSTQTTPGTAPSDAIVLFNGKDLSMWKNHSDGQPAWKVENGHIEIAPKRGSLSTAGEYGPDIQLHIEWSAPQPASGNGQGRGNSGVLFFGKYEVQVLDSYENKTYPDGQAASLYGFMPPLVNATRPPGAWNIYDIIFNGARFENDKLVSPTIITVLHNGVVAQNHIAVPGPTSHKGLPTYKPHPEKGPIVLQDHGNPVQYRNIWLRELKPVDSK
jgi:hypothetical protein